MGVESFQVVLTCKAQPMATAVATLLGLQGVREGGDTSPLPGERHFVLNDGGHVIEIEVRPLKDEVNGCRISCRCAICHPVTVLGTFARNVKSLSASLSTPIDLIEDVPSGIPDLFRPPLFEGFETALRESFLLKKRYWVQDFGEGEASVSCAEAIRRFILPHCDGPSVE